MSLVSVVLSLTVVVCGDSVADDAVCAADVTSVDMIVEEALREGGSFAIDSSTWATGGAAACVVEEMFGSGE